MGSRNWNHDERIVKPVLEANGYYAVNDGKYASGSHTKFVNGKGESVIITKKLNRMVWRKEVKRNHLVGGMAIVGKLKG